MGNQESSQCRSLEFLIDEHRNEFLEELSRFTGTNPFPIDQNAINSIKESQNFVIFSKGSNHSACTWNKLDFSVCILTANDAPIQLNQGILFHFSKIPFAVIHLDPISCDHLSFFLNKAKFFLSRKEFLDRILLIIQTNQPDLMNFLKTKKYKPLNHKPAFEITNPFNEPSFQSDALFQSSSYAAFKRSKNMFSMSSAFDSDGPPRNSQDNSQNQNNSKQKQKQKILMSVQNKQRNKEKSHLNQDLDQSDSSLEFLSQSEEEDSYSYSYSYSYSKVTTPNNSQYNSRNGYSNRSPGYLDSTSTNVINLTTTESEFNYPRRANQNNIPNRKPEYKNNSQISSSDSYYENELENENIVDKNKRTSRSSDYKTSKNESDHLSSLFDFSMTESKSNHLQSGTSNRSNNPNYSKKNSGSQKKDMYIDFTDESSVLNRSKIKNWIPKGDVLSEDDNITLLTKSDHQQRKVKRSEAQSPRRQKNNLEQLSSNFDSTNDTSGFLGLQQTHRNKPGSKLQKNRNNQQSLGKLTSDFDGNSMSSNAGIMNFTHNFKSSSENIIYSNNDVLSEDGNLSTFHDDDDEAEVKSSKIVQQQTIPSPSIIKIDFNPELESQSSSRRSNASSSSKAHSSSHQTPNRSNRTKRVQIVSNQDQIKRNANDESFLDSDQQKQGRNKVSGNINRKPQTDSRQLGHLNSDFENDISSSTASSSKNGIMHFTHDFHSSSSKSRHQAIPSQKNRMATSMKNSHNRQQGINRRQPISKTPTAKRTVIQLDYSDDS